MTVTGTVAVTVTVAVAGRAYGCRRATRVGGGDTKQNQFFRVRCAVEGRLTHTSRLLVMCSQASMRELGGELK